MRGVCRGGGMLACWRSVNPSVGSWEVVECVVVSRRFAQGLSVRKSVKLGLVEQHVMTMLQKLFCWEINLYGGFLESTEVGVILVQDSCCIRVC